MSEKNIYPALLFRPITASPSHKLSPPMSMNSKISGIPGIINIKKSLSFKNITTGQKGTLIVSWSFEQYKIRVHVPKKETCCNKKQKKCNGGVNKIHTF